MISQLKGERDDYLLQFSQLKRAIAGGCRLGESGREKKKEWGREKKRELGREKKKEWGREKKRESGREKDERRLLM